MTDTVLDMTAGTAWRYDDGGRSAAGFSGEAGDCVTRAIAIATGVPYADVYNALAALARQPMKHGRGLARGGSPRNGVHRSIYEEYLASLGWSFTPTMSIGSGCRVHLRVDELPPIERIIVRLSGHLAAVIDGVTRDTHDPSRGGTRCVYGYYAKGKERAS